MSALSVGAQPSSLTVPRVDWGATPAIEHVDEMFETASLETHSVDCLNWPEQFPERPEVGFKIAHSGDEIYLKFYVHESELRAAFTADNGQPWTDSCVEFFVIPGEEGSPYYNIEMSCIGYGLLHTRDAQGQIVMLEKEVGQIRRLPSLPREAIENTEGDFRWTLTMAIPVSAFACTEVAPLSGRTLRGNFYKCGDGLPRPQYLSWSPIDTPRPSFHQPKFFGELRFE